MNKPLNVWDDALGNRVVAVPAISLPLTAARADNGAVLTATATGGAMGISRTAGTSLALVGETPTASAATDKALWEILLPNTYVPGNNITVALDAVVTGAGTLTAASTTLAVAAYTEIAGVEAALTVTGSQQFGKTESTYTFTVTGTNLVAGQRIVIEVTMVVTTSAGACTGNLKEVTVTA